MSAEIKTAAARIKTGIFSSEPAEIIQSVIIDGDEKNSTDLNIYIRGLEQKNQSLSAELIDAKKQIDQRIKDERNIKDENDRLNLNVNGLQKQNAILQKSLDEAKVKANTESPLAMLDANHMVITPIRDGESIEITRHKAVMILCQAFRNDLTGDGVYANTLFVSHPELSKIEDNSEQRKIFGLFVTRIKAEMPNIVKKTMVADKENMTLTYKDQ